VKAVAERMVADAKTLMAEGVGFVAINANDPIAYPEDSLPNMKLFAARHAFPFPYLLDETQEVAPRLRCGLHAGVLRGLQGRHPGLSRPPGRGAGKASRLPARNASWSRRCE